MDATDPQPELRPADVVAPRHAECYDLWFTGVGGARVYAKYIRPKYTADGAATAKRPAVLQFHGYFGHSGDWFDKLGLAGEGFCYAAMDVRGQGGQSGRKRPGQGHDRPRPHRAWTRQPRPAQARVPSNFSGYGAARPGGDELRRSRRRARRLLRHLPGRRAGAGLRRARAADPAGGAGVSVSLRLPARVGAGLRPRRVRGAAAVPPLPRPGAAQAGEGDLHQARLHRRCSTWRRASAPTC